MSILWGNFLFQLIAFGILFWLLSRYAFGPLMGIMKKRQDEIARQIENAETHQQEAEKLLAEQKALLQEARQEARDIVERARITGEKQGEDILRQAKEEAARQQQEALAEIQHEKEQALSALREQVASLSVEVASKIIRKELDLKTQQALVDDFVEQVGRVQ